MQTSLATRTIKDSFRCIKIDHTKVEVDFLSVANGTIRHSEAYNFLRFIASGSDLRVNRVFAIEKRRVS